MRKCCKETASIIRAEYIKERIKTREDYTHELEKFAEIKDAECQKRVERIFEEIEAKFEDVTGDDSVEQILAIPKYKWQALKKQEEVK